MRQRLHLVRVVARAQHRRPVVRRRPDELPRRALGVGVEAGRRLVVEQQLGSANDAQTDVEASLLFARGSLDRGVGLVAPTHDVENLVDAARVRVVTRVATKDLTNREEGLDGEFLQDHTDALTKPHLVVRDPGRCRAPAHSRRRV